MSDDVRILGFPGMSAAQARRDATALLIAKWISLGTGTTDNIEEAMSTFLADPQRLGSVTLVLLNLCAQYATQSGRNPNGLKQLIDFMITQFESRNL